MRTIKVELGVFEAFEEVVEGRQEARWIEGFGITQRLRISSLENGVDEGVLLT